MIKRLYILIIVFLNTSFLSAQNNFDYTIYDKYSYNTYHKYKPFHQEIDFDNINYPLLHAAIFFATNETRVKKKKSVLEFHPKLEKSAQMHSKDMVKYKFFGHINKHDKSHETPKDRASLAGIENPYMAENVAEEFGLQYISGEDVYVLGPGEFSKSSGGEPIPHHTYYTLAQRVLESWMNSPPHKKNIMRDEAQQLGCGAWYYENDQFNSMPTFLFTQNFQLYEKIE